MGWVGSGHTKWTHGQLCTRHARPDFVAAETGVSELDLYYDSPADSAVMARMSLIVRHLGLVVGSGACALAVCVVVVVTAIACRVSEIRESACYERC